MSDSASAVAAPDSACGLRAPGTDRLASIDALRGVAAIGVVVYHATRWRTFSVDPSPLGSLVNLPITLFSAGYSGVFLFFVLSGFCIHLKWAKNLAAGRESKLDFAAFWKRRIRRLYPPYLAAFGLYLIVASLQGEIKPSSFLAYDIVSHLLMLHNLDARTTYSLSGVFWTLAIEEQLYLAYFLLLGLRRRLGWAPALAFTLLARYAWYGLHYGVLRLTGFVLPVGESFAANWFAWALGALGVEFALGLVRPPAWAKSLALGAALVFLAAFLDHQLRFHNADTRAGTVWSLVGFPVWGIAFFIVVNWAVGLEARLRKPSGLRPTVAVLAWFGLFSYSLYLTHELVTYNLGKLVLPRLRLSQDGELLFALAALVPLSVAFAYGYFLAVERPFLSRKPSTDPVSPIIRVDLSLAHELG